MKLIYTILLSLFISFSFAQDLNQLDSNGERHGNWKKNFEDTKVLRYEGTFDHGKEVGTFKFYKNINGQAILTATRTFNSDTDLAQVKFYSSTKHLISEGQMRGKTYVGRWVYYHNKSKQIMTQEFYNNKGELEGEKRTYYLSGKMAKKENYVGGVLNGESRSFSETEKLISVFNYTNNELHGPAKIYDTKGDLQMEGVYQKDRRHGLWKFYENGKLKEEKDLTRRSNNPVKKRL
ncbi:toxin-antitoxin system YwqK family antitoxin [Lacinutrix neustonica]|uniref:Toxin-antitoxin system YwqK family antitoxin n=1 Tax=Lacinutrix neustonica TaxID=2980107 RepID=A0A9E8N0C7_9FLAO|nr:toxin-antitoxin system YwqK family antitoxin [Lacinutrix neustonica]WAC03540.1 toxin-antitoxin system YwqK family antitoxin [Lacinutrix neustonica]